MNTILATLVLCGSASLLPAAASSGGVRVQFSHTLDISALNLTSVGDLALQRSSNSLWISDGTSGNTAYRLSPLTGALLGQVSLAAVPGLASGPEGLAVFGATNDLAAFSSIGESAAGRVSQSGALLSNYGSGFDATGAEVTSSQFLITVSGAIQGGGSIVRVLNSTTGVITGSVPLQHPSRMLDIAEDPHENLFHCITEDTNQLVEVSLGDGSIGSTFDLSPFLLQGNTIHGGLAFNLDGSNLFVATGTGAAADRILVFTRSFTRILCDGATPGVACPCGNAGLPAHGCENSLGNGGATLDSAGRPDVSNDSFSLTAGGLPPGATGLFFQGTLPIDPGATFGDGLRCVGGTVIRLSTKTATNGTMSYPGPGDEPIHARGLVPSSATRRYYQVWYRNSASFCTSATFNLTNALDARWVP